MSAASRCCLDVSLSAGPMRARIVSTGVAAGDFSPDVHGVTTRRRSIVDAPWTWLHQEHGARVVVVDSPGAHAGATADAAVTTVAHAPVSVRTADCAPVVLVGDGGLGVVHAGWRGVVAGVIGAAATEMDRLGVAAHHAVVGPCICAGCYEFGPADLDRVVAVAGPDVAASTRNGRPGLDLRAGVTSMLTAAGVHEVDVDDRCTACGDGLWSHRARGDEGRQATVAWLEYR